jgi:FkbM family methyltransferase
MPIFEIEEGTIEHGGAKSLIRLFKNDVSLKIAGDILAGKTYPHVHFVEKVHTIVDIGANVGAATIFFSLLYPHARVLALEPASAPFSLLSQNVAPFPNVKAFPLGLFSCDKVVPLYPGQNDSVESSVSPSSRTAAEPEEVKLRCANQFMMEQGVGSIDILKVDTEGCEVHILRSLQRFLPMVKLIYVEYHSDRDRRLIDLLLADTHNLWRGHADLIYRGELCYLNRTLVPDQSVTYSTEITLPLD